MEFTDELGRSGLHQVMTQIDVKLEVNKCYEEMHTCKKEIWPGCEELFSVKKWLLSIKSRKSEGRGVPSTLQRAGAQ